MSSIEVLVVEVDEDRIKDLANWPAVHSGTRNVYIFQNNVIVGKARLSSTYGDRVTVDPDDAARDHFKDLESFRILGKYAFMRFQTYDGKPYPEDFNEDGEPCIPDDVFIVDDADFDYGLASTRRYGHLPGFGAKSNKSTPVMEVEGSDGKEWVSGDGRTRMFLTDGAVWFLSIDGEHVDQDFDSSKLMHRNSLWFT